MAVSDPTGTIASPYALLERSGDQSLDRRRLADAVREVEAERIVVGLPIGLSGQLGPAALETMAEVEALAEMVVVPVETYDERFTTVSAERTLRAVGVASSSKARKRVVDKMAAAVMLQAWLDRRGHAVEQGGS